MEAKYLLLRHLPSSWISICTIHTKACSLLGYLFDPAFFSLFLWVEFLEWRPLHKQTVHTLRQSKVWEKVASFLPKLHTAANNQKHWKIAHLIKTYRLLCSVDLWTNIVSLLPKQMQFWLDCFVTIKCSKSGQCCRIFAVALKNQIFSYLLYFCFPVKGNSANLTKMALSLAFFLFFK